MSRGKRRNFRLPNNRDSKNISKDFPLNKSQSNQKMLHTLDEAIDEWAPKNYTNESPNIRLARINNSNISLEALINRFANRLIHCRIRVDENFSNVPLLGMEEIPIKEWRRKLRLFVIKNDQKIS